MTPTADLGEPYWRKVRGLGDWVRVVDVVRFRRPNLTAAGLGSATTTLVRRLRDAGCEVRLYGRQNFVRRKDLDLIPELESGSTAEWLKRTTTKGRDRLYDLASEMDLDGMDIAEVFEALGEHADLVFEALEGE
jgi:hypothetical protein